MVRLAAATRPRAQSHHATGWRLRASRRPDRAPRRRGVRVAAGAGLGYRGARPRARPRAARGRHRPRPATRHRRAAARGASRATPVTTSSARALGSSGRWGHRTSSTVTSWRRFDAKRADRANRRGRFLLAGVGRSGGSRSGLRPVTAPRPGPTLPGRCSDSPHLGAAHGCGSVPESHRLPLLQEVLHRRAGGPMTCPRLPVAATPWAFARRRRRGTRGRVKRAVRRPRAPTGSDRGWRRTTRGAGRSARRLRSRSTSR